MDSKNFAGMMNEIRAPLLVLILLLASAAALYMLSPHERALVDEEQEDAPLSEAIRTGEAPIPEFTEEIQQRLEQSGGFQSLVSYTDGGFEPTTLTVKRGDTVRFTNNSSDDVWIAAYGTNGQLYPRTKEGCGSSDLDSCAPIAPMDFWEFTFEREGEWNVANNLDKRMRVMVTVEL